MADTESAAARFRIIVNALKSKIHELQIINSEKKPLFWLVELQDFLEGLEGQAIDGLACLLYGNENDKRVIINNLNYSTMATLQLKGKFLVCGTPEELGEKRTLVQKVHLMVPGYVDGFGDKKGQDEVWELSVMGDNVAKLGLSNEKEGKKAIVKIFLNSNTVPAAKTTVNREMYIINAVLHSYELVP